jgi:hypothetical protein
VLPNPRALLLSGLGLALLLLAGHPLAGQGKGKEKGKDKKRAPAPAVSYYPLKTGNTWDYAVTKRTGERVEKRKATVRVLSEETVEKVRVAVLETTYEGRKVTERLAADRDGLYRFSGEGVDYKPPLCLLKLPPKKGATWTVESRGDGLKISGKFKAAEEGEVTVPAGKFGPVFISSCDDFRVDGVKMSLTYWFVPGIGLVKQRVFVGGRELILELEKYTLNK